MRQGAVDGTAGDTAGGGSPNGGLLTTLGSLGVGVTDLASFDIIDTGRNGLGAAFAVMQLQGDSISKLFSINLTAGLMNQPLGSATLIGTVGGDELITAMDIGPPLVTLSTVNSFIAETSIVAEVYVTRTGGSGSTSKVTFNTSDGSATDGDDYTAVQNFTMTFAPGETQKTVQIPLAAITGGEPAETLNLTLSNVTGGATQLGSPSMATLTILPVADTPSVTDATTERNTQTVDGLVISRNAADSTEVTHFKITGITGGTLFQNDGTTGIANGDFITFAQGNAGLKFTPATDSFADGSFHVQASISSSDDGLGGGLATATVVVESTPTIAAGGAGSDGSVKVLNSDGSTRFNVIPYAGVAGGVRVASGDVTGDGIDDIITGPAGAVAGHVKVFDGVTGAEIRSFFAFTPTFNGGITVAGGDLNGDTIDDIVVGAGPGAGPHVKVFDGATGAELHSFFAYSTTYSGGVNIASGEINSDGRDDVVTGSSTANGHVKAFSGTDQSLLQSFFAFDGFSGGVNVAVSSIGGFDRVVTGSGAGTNAHVKVFDGAGAVQASFFAFPGFLGGVRVAGTVDGKVIAAAGPRRRPPCEGLRRCHRRRTRVLLRLRFDLHRRRIRRLKTGTWPRGPGLETGAALFPMCLSRGIIP